MNKNKLGLEFFSVLALALANASIVLGSDVSKESQEKTAKPSPSANLTPEEKALVKKARESFKTANQQPPPSKALQKRMQSESDVSLPASSPGAKTGSGK